MEMLKYLKWIMPLMPLTLGVEDGAGGGDGNENQGETVSKTDFDNVSGERDKLTKDLDDVRAEVFTPEYMAFLDGKDKTPKVEDKPKEESITDDQFEKMSKKDILALATKNAVEAINKTLVADKTTQKIESDAAVAREIAVFAKTHTDYEKFRPAMYGISLKPEHKHKGLQALYDEAKVYAKSLQEEPTEAEKIKQRAMDGQKPENSSGTYAFDKKIDGDAAANEAAEETAEKLGTLPSA